MDIIGDTFTEDHDKVFAKVFDDILGGNVPEVPNVDHAVRDFDLDTTTCHGVKTLWTTVTMTARVAGVAAELRLSAPSSLPCPYKNESCSGTFTSDCYCF